MTAKDRILVLSREDIESLLKIEDAIEAVEEGFKLFNSGKAVVPFPVALQVPDHAGDVHIKPGYLIGNSTYTVKIASGFYENPGQGIPPSHGMLLLFDSRTGYPICFEIDRGYITDLRTAAAGAVAARALARSSVRQACVIGTGVQARLQMIALMKVRQFDELRVWGRTPGKVKEYVDDMSKVLGIRVYGAKSAEEAVRDSDIVVTATMSTTPIVKADWLKRGVHITAVGSDSPEKQELETKILGIADKVVADSVKQCSELGEIHHAVKDGSITLDNVHGELGEILLGTKAAREDDAEITVCDLTGLAVQDVMTSRLAYDRAREVGRGTYIEV